MSIQIPGRDTDAFLSILDARISALQELRASYLAARATGALGRPEELAAALGGTPASVPQSVAVEPAHVVTIPSVAAAPAVEPSLPSTLPAAPTPPPMPEIVRRRKRQQGIAAAVRTYLKTMDGAKRAVDIARDLRHTGLMAPKLEQTVTSLLHRLRQRGEVERVPEGWLRTAPGTDVPNRLPARLRGSRPPASPGPDRREGGLAWKIESMLKSHGQPVAARVVAEATGEPLNVVGLTLGRMVRQQRVEKQPDGRFSVLMAVEHDTAGAPAPLPTPEQNGHDTGNGDLSQV